MIMNRDGIVQCATSREGFVALCLYSWCGVYEKAVWFLSHGFLSVSVRLIGARGGRTRPHGRRLLSGIMESVFRDAELPVSRSGSGVTQHGAGNSVKRWERDCRGSGNMIFAPSKSKRL
ncbi:hypothetical protein FQA47_007123 [Oryzias melastigma]|uniref:Uncharacterized protein n=1 Tax=Oryzias melastigma TaxID=30732 RepID=A0A834F1K7_ORYME|nr:hypothetical protein FQA47_007123 [Oryzias melastigma]